MLDELILGRPESSAEGPNTKSEYLGDLFKNLVGGSKASSIFPVGEDFKFYESFPEFKTQTTQLGKRLLSLIDRVCQAVGEQQTSLVELDSDTDKFNAVVETVDNLLEQVDLHLDDMSGLNKNDRLPARAVTTQGPRANPNLNRSSLAMMKPQLKFKDKIDNSTAPFVPILPNKPHARTPLPDYNSQPADRRSFPHPYEFEIANLTYSRPQVSTCKEQLFQPVTEVPCHWIDSEDQLRDLEQKLTRQKEFAVDLEHHSFRTFHGFTCLMQISTRTEDFLIDTLELRHLLHILNSSFADPKIVKVLHGADMDILWLQRDFGLYVVNLFDTGQAARVLDAPYFSLQWLLKHYCDIELNKKYQLADWRLRPLSLEMLLYAREDTHYLLYVYDRLRNQLTETNQAKGSQMLPLLVDGEEMRVASLLAQTLERSQQVALKRWEKAVLSPSEHSLLCSKHGLVYTDPQLRTMKALMQWRDLKAREEDESLGFVMPNHVLINICNAMPLDSARLLDCCRPATPLIRAATSDIIKLIHQSQLLPSSPTTVPMTPMASLPEPCALSPVMNTDQLYQSAGWITGNQGPRGAGGLPLFDMSGFSSPTRLGRQVSAPVVLAGATQGFSSLLRQCPDPFNQTTREIQNHLQTASRMSVLPPDKVPVKREPSETLFETPFPKRSRAEVISPDVPAIQNIVSPESTGVPRSMHEIYQLSNENRQRNKEKKKPKEDPKTTSPEPVVDSPGAFMQHIGWTVDKRPSSSSSSAPPASSYTVATEYFNPHADPAPRGDPRGDRDTRPQKRR